jgi:transposase
MGNPRGVRRDFDALEKRRFAAVRLFETTDLNNSEIGRRLKVCNQTVSRWRGQFLAGGASAVRQAGCAGRKPLLGGDDRERLGELLKQGPEQLGYETPLWTCQRVGHLIENEFGVRYHAGHVWKILRQLNWTVQRPAGRALERDEELIRHWKQERWPAIKKKPKKRPGRSSSSTKAG